MFNLLNKYWALITISFGGLLIRLYNLSAISLWHDEAFSALLIKYSWGEMIYRIGLDVHPPAYYFLLRLWHYLFSDSLFSLRALSVFFGVATIFVTYLLVKKIFDNTTTALIAALLVAVNPFQIQYVTEARMYTMGAFFAVLATYFLVLALTATKKYYTIQNDAQPSHVRLFFYYTGFVISSSILTYTHYYLFFTVVALGLYGLFYLWMMFKWKLKGYLYFILSCVSIGLLFLPWLKIFLFQYRQVGAGYWIPPINIWSIPGTLYELFIRIGQPSKALMITGSLFTIFIIYQIIKQYRVTEKWLILAVFLAPFAGSLLFALMAKIQGQHSSVYLVRYFLFASPFLLIILALWLQQLKIYNLKWLLLVTLVITNLVSVSYYWNNLNISKKPGMAGLAKIINANVEYNHKLFVASSFQFFNFKYYNQTQVRPLLYTNGHTLNSLPHYSGTAILTAEDIALNWQDYVTAGDTAWVIWTSAFGGHKPLVPNNWKQTDEHGFAEVRPYETWIVVTQYQIN